MFQTEISSSVCNLINYILVKEQHNQKSMFLHFSSLFAFSYQPKILTGQEIQFYFSFPF